MVRKCLKLEGACALPAQAIEKLPPSQQLQVQNFPLVFTTCRILRNPPLKVKLCQVPKKVQKSLCPSFAVSIQKKHHEMLSDVSFITLERECLFMTSPRPVREPEPPQRLERAEDGDLKNVMLMFDSMFIHVCGCHKNIIFRGFSSTLQASRSPRKTLSGYFIKTKENKESAESAQVAPAPCHQRFEIVDIDIADVCDRGMSCNFKPCRSQAAVPVFEESTSGNF